MCVLFCCVSVKATSAPRARRRAPAAAIPPYHVRLRDTNARALRARALPSHCLRAVMRAHVPPAAALRGADSMIHEHRSSCAYAFNGCTVQSIVPTAAPSSHASDAPLTSEKYLSLAALPSGLGCWSP